MEYRSLQGVSPKVIAAAFEAAFADYAVPMAMPEEKMLATMKTRSYDAAISVGAFDNGVLVGFVLNGLRVLDGKLTAYDMGTGVLPAYRGKGVSSAMLAQVQMLLEANGVKAYVLEVLQENTTAIALYKKQAFTETRELLCYSVKREKINADAPVLWQVELSSAFTQEDWADAQNLWSATPSWQNAPEAVQALPNDYEYLTVRGAGQLIGYAILNKTGGTIMQLCVSENMRGQGVGKALAAKLAAVSAAEELRLVNLDASCVQAARFLEATGFDLFVKQWEMQKLI